MARRLDVKALALEGDHEGLLAAIEDEDPGVRRAALVVLADNGMTAPVATAAVESPYADSRAIAAELLAQAPADALTPLLAATRDPDRQVRAAEALGAARAAAATAPLLEMLAGDGSAARTAAAEALGRIQDPRAAPALLSAAEDRDPSVRDVAKQALAAVGSATAFGFAALPRTAALDSQEFAESVGALLEIAPPSQPALDPSPAAQPTPARPNYAPAPTVESVPSPATAAPRPEVPVPVPAPARAAPPVRPRRPRRRGVMALAAALLAAGVVAAMQMVALGGHSRPRNDEGLARSTPMAVATPIATAAPPPRGASPREVAARRRAGSARKAADGAHTRLTAKARAAAAARKRAANSLRRAVATRPAVQPVTRKPTPVVAKATPQPAVPAPTAAPPAPRPTAAPQSTPQISQPDPVP